MFEFLKECNNFTMYERAVSCEKIIGDVNDILVFRVFCEAAIKSIYYKEFNKNPEIDRTNLQELMQNTGLRDIIATKYRFNSLGTLDRITRIKGNSAAHDEHPERISDEMRIRQFMSLYELASCIYTARTGKHVKSITKDEVSGLINARKSPAETDRIIRELQEQLAERDSELSKKDTVISAQSGEIAANRRRIEALERERTAKRLEAARKEEEKELLKKELEEAKLSRIDPAVLAKYQSEIEEKNREISTFKNDISILSKRLERAEKQNNEDKLRQLQEQAKILQAKLDAADEEKGRLTDELKQQAESTCDKQVVAELEKQLKQKDAELKNANRDLQKAVDELETFKSKSTAEATPLDAVEEHYKGFKKFIEEEERLNSQIIDLKKNINQRSPHKCPNCGRPLELSKSRESWHCRNWQEEKDKHQINAYRELTSEEYDIFIAPLVKLEKQKEAIKGLEAEWLRKNAPGANPKTPIAAPPEVLNILHKDETDVEEYPLSLTKSSPVSYIFQTLSVPDTVFSEKEELDLKKHCKFRVWYEKILTDNAADIPSAEKNIYSLVLRLLNRGFILKTGKATAKKLGKEFNKSQYGKAEMLTDYIEYKNPVMQCDSLRERRFAQDYFPSVLGKSWASYVISQPSMDELIPKDNMRYDDCRADFLVSNYSSQIRPLIIELDGYEHKDSSVYDRVRRMTLRNNGYDVMSFNNYELDRGSEKVKANLADYFAVDIPEHIVTVDSRYLAACKMQHQFAIAIVKALEKGYITKKASFKASVSTKLFNDLETAFILQTAIDEVEELIGKYCELYGIELDIDLNDESGHPVHINIGDGEPSFKGITIRDSCFVWDYLCTLEKFDPQIRPKKTLSKLLSFFSEYIFGIDKFRPGQLKALQYLLHKEDCVALLPTGSGKSLIYQLTSYLVPGMIVVISPLKSLIIDQISNLAYRFGINNTVGIMSRSGQSQLEQRKNDIRHMKCNSSSLLYISPERLQIPSFREDLKDMLQNNNVFAVAVDEAHCASEWGHDFRPSYLVIGRNCKKMFSDASGSPAIAALTGTASTNVREDIIRILQINRNRIVYPETFERKNLHFSVYKCDSEEKTQNLSYMIRHDLPEMLEKSFEEFAAKKGADTSSGIIFTPYTKGRKTEYSAMPIAESLSMEIPELKIANYFSSVPDKYDRETWEAIIASNAKAFREDKVNLLVATKAFGMGIDKANIRYTIHDCFPQSIESFYQEAGRAGRDDKPSQCLVLFSDANTETNEKLMDISLNLEELRKQFHDYEKMDDVHAMLYFHLNGFRGIEDECNTANKIIDILPLEYKTGQHIDICTNRQDFTNAEQDDNGKAIAQAVVRLLRLGVFEDYMYDYSKKTYVVIIGQIVPSSVKKKFEGYIRSYSQADVLPQMVKLSRIVGIGKDYLKAVTKQLIEYTYGQIEHSRRQQLISIYTLMKKVAYDEPDEQNEKIKDEIDKYFSLPKDKKGDPIYDILQSPDIRFDIALELGDKASDNYLEKEEASTLAGRATHELESASTRPDLILLRVIAQVIAGEYNARMLANDITAAERFAKERYNIDGATLKETIENTYNIILENDTDLFDTVVERRAEYKRKPVSEILKMLMKSNTITDINRDYIVMKYYTDSISHML